MGTNIAEPRLTNVVRSIYQLSDAQFQALEMYLNLLQQIPTQEPIETTSTDNPEQSLTFAEILSWSTPRRSAAEIDAYINEERDAWGF